MLEVRACRAEHVAPTLQSVIKPPYDIIVCQRPNTTRHFRAQSVCLTLAMSYMTEILNSQSMKAPSGYETLLLSTYWKRKGTEGICVSAAALLSQLMERFMEMCV